jgi:hypothetical protein
MGIGLFARLGISSVQELRAGDNGLYEGREPIAIRGQLESSALAAAGKNGLRGWRIAAMASDAIPGNKGAHGLRELPVQRGIGSFGRGNRENCDNSGRQTQLNEEGST